MINMSKVDLNLFVAFEVIFREQSITAAANTLNLTQPAVSHALARLRILFNDPLFVRQGNRMSPTPVAKQHIAQIRNALDQFGHVIQQPNVFTPINSQRNFLLAMRDVLESTILPPLLTNIQREAPNTTLFSTRVNRKDLSKKLSSGEIDLFIDVLLPKEPEILLSPFLDDGLIVMCRDGHECLTKPWNLKRYLAYDHVAVSSRSDGPSIEDIELGNRQQQRNIKLRCQHYFAASRVVAQSDFLLTMPRTYAGIIAKNLPLTLIEFPVKMNPIQLYIYWHQQADSDPAHRWLRHKLLNLSTNKKTT